MVSCRKGNTAPEEKNPDIHTLNEHLAELEKAELEKRAKRDENNYGLLEYKGEPDQGGNDTTWKDLVHTDPNPNKCSTSWDDERYSTSDEPWYKASTWVDNLVAAKNVVTDFFKGLVEGFGDQAQDIIEILKNPSLLLDAAKSFASDPTGFIAQVLEGLGQDVRQLMQCGPGDIGQIIGQNVSPVQAIGVIAKISGSAKLAKLVKSIDGKNKNPDNKPKNESAGNSNPEQERTVTLNRDCSSFLAGTPIAVPGGHKNIEDIQVGDEVLSQSAHRPFKPTTEKVTKLLSRTAQEYMVMQTEFGTIAATPDHPFWVQGLAWQRMFDLEYNDLLATRWGDVMIYDIKVVKEPTKVYNFAVHNTKNYFATELDLWVHNIPKAFEIEVLKVSSF